MPVTEGFRDFVFDQIAGCAPFVWKRMFSGIGLWSDEIFFGIMWDDTLYLRGGPNNLRLFRRLRAKPFRPYPDRPSTEFGYWHVPVSVLEDVDTLHDCVKSAIEAGRLACMRPRGSRRRSSSASGSRSRGPARRGRKRKPTTS